LKNWASERRASERKSGRKNYVCPEYIPLSIKEDNQAMAKVMPPGRRRFPIPRAFSLS
jgi:hypothetical protein